MENSKQYPIILVFYMDRELMASQVMGGLADSINSVIAERDANIMAFFVPTDGEEKIDCVNPILVKEADMERINKIIGDLSDNFDIGKGADKDKNN